MGQLIDRKCHCGRVFQVQPSRLKHGRGRCCSRECQYAKPKPADNFNCATCGKSFYRTTVKARHGHQFCSRACHYAGRSAGLVQRIVSRPYRLPPKAPNRCVFCASEFIPRQRALRHCSRACELAAQSARMVGDKNWAYKHGLSKRHKRCYRGPLWDATRKAIYARDKWLCRRCGKHCGAREIQCHHVVPYRLSKDNRETNLITLCKSCHTTVHERPGDNGDYIRLVA